MKFLWDKCFDFARLAIPQSQKGPLITIPMTNGVWVRSFCPDELKQTFLGFDPATA